MTVTFDATVGGANANSYATVAQADDYFSTSYGKTAVWAPLSNSVKESLLIEATRLVDSLYDFIGYSKPDQALRWPRNFAPKLDTQAGYAAENQDAFLGDSGNYWPNDVIPPGIQYGMFEIAWSIFQNLGLPTDEREITELKIASILLKFDPTKDNSGFPKIALDILSQFGTSRMVAKNAMYAVRLQRV